MNEPVPHHDQLPLPDYDHLPLEAVQARIRSLDAEALRAVLAYERAHGNRLPVVQLLEQRLEAVEAGAPLSEGSPTGRAPEVDHASHSGDTASPQTEGPPVNPPSQGVPTNPAQPRT